jgi:hypothetical protein
MSGVEAWMEPCAWGRDLVVSWPAAPGEEPPHLAVVVFDPEGRPGGHEQRARVAPR